MERLSLGWFARGLALLAVFVMAVHAFQSGVDVSDRPGLPNAELLTQLYYAAGLFVLGGLDLGTPVSGPGFERALLWASYFLAPAITTSAVIEGALRLVGSRAFEKIGLKQHLVVVGLGNLGTTFVAAVRRVQPHRVLVAVERDVSRPRLDQVRRQHDVRLIPGDARIASSFSSLRLDRAVGVALLTEDDLLNLDVGLRLSKAYPALPVIAHVSNISLQRAALEVEQQREGSKFKVFNGHRITAEHLFENHLKRYFAETSEKDRVVLAGFGRFGQTIFELLEHQAQTEIGRLLIADRVAALRFRVYRAEVPVEHGIEPTTLDGELSDPELWQEILARLGPEGPPPVVIIGSDSDHANLQSALWARRCWPECKAFVRFQNQSDFAEKLAERYQFVALGVETMLLRALADAQSTWFETTKD